MAISKPAATPIIISTVFPVLAILAVAGRFYARQTKKNPTKLDDWFAVLALIGCIANASVLIVASIHGELGKKQPLDSKGIPLPNPSLEIFQKCIYANEITSTVTITLTRTAVLLLYTHIFFVQTYFIILVTIVHVLNSTWGIAFTLTYIFQCWPIDLQWKKVYQHRVGGKCINGAPQRNTYAISSVLLDALMLLLPWPYILRLHVPLKDKFAVGVMFFLGVLVVAASIGKTWNFYYVGELISKDLQITYNESTLMYWTVPETCVAVICSCLPTLRPVASKLSEAPVLKSLHSIWSNSRSGFSETLNPIEMQAQHPAPPTKENATTPDLMTHGLVREEQK